MVGTCTQFWEILISGLPSCIILSRQKFHHKYCLMQIILPLLEISYTSCFQEGVSIYLQNSEIKWKYTLLRDGEYSLQAFRIQWWESMYTLQPQKTLSDCCFLSAKSAQGKARRRSHREAEEGRCIGSLCRRLKEATQEIPAGTRKWCGAGAGGHILPAAAQV